MVPKSKVNFSFFEQQLQKEQRKKKQRTDIKKEAKKLYKKSKELILKIKQSRLRDITVQGAVEK